MLCAAKKLTENWLFGRIEMFCESRGGGIGRHVRLKISSCLGGVRVQVPPSAFSLFLIHLHDTIRNMQLPAKLSYINSQSKEKFDKILSYLYSFLLSISSDFFK